MSKETGKRQPLIGSHVLLPDELARKVFDVDERAILQSRIDELSKLLWRHGEMSKKDFDVEITRALEHFNSLKPRDGAESMLATQMVATHLAALECLRRAALPNQTFEGRDMALRHAHKLMTLYAKQLDTLNKHRGRNQQKVRVEHVHIEKGRKAVVGKVRAGNQPANDSQGLEVEQKHDENVPLNAARKAKMPRKRGS